MTSFEDPPIPEEPHANSMSINNAIDLSNSNTFDPILFFNTQFPDEESLDKLPSVIDDFTFEIKRLDKEIFDGIHKHSVINKQLK